jgi:hypothetical protein
MKTRNRNQEANPKHQKQVHEKKRQTILWIQRNISNKYEVKKRIAFINYVTGMISAYNAEIEQKVGSGLLDEENADNMKEEFSHKMDIFIQMWSEGGEKGLKEKIEELLSTKEETTAKQDTGCAATNP